MPLYEYEYQDGSGRFSVNQRISEETLKVHDGKPCIRLISASQVIFRGDGWHNKGPGLDAFRKIYERNVSEAEVARQFARERGIDFTGDSGAVVPSDDDAPPEV